MEMIIKNKKTFEKVNFDTQSTNEIKKMKNRHRGVKTKLFNGRRLWDSMGDVVSSITIGVAR